MSLEILKNKYKFPATKPNVLPSDHGWFGEGNQRVLSKCLNKNTKVVIELGSWLGKSTRFIAEKSINANVIAIDHWKGSPEHYLPHRTDVKDFLPVLYETFIASCWKYRNRIIPIRKTTNDGLKIVKDASIKPDLIYIDASHETEHVLSDISICITYFPTAVITGDDWDRGISVKAGVIKFLTNNKDFNLHTDHNCWYFTRR